jgi:DNA (cytosine-5)-methyltransferase 3A
MKVLSLFDGMGCLGIALKDMGYEFEYYTSEIDKHAIAQSKLNFPDSVQLGDVTKWKQWDIDWSKIDVIGAGSPCQGFSFAGKQLAFDDPRSALFFVFVEILEHIKKHNPKVIFLLENVKMKKEHELVITKYMGVAPIEINAALVSAQNRRRLFWTNIKNEPYGLFGDMQCTIPQPEDRGIFIKDILEADVSEKYYLSEKQVKEMSLWKSKDNPLHRLKINNNKSRALLAKGMDSNSFSMELILTSIDCNVKDNFIITHSTQPRTGKGQGGKGHLFKTDQKTYCLDTSNSQAIEIKHKGVIQLNPSNESNGCQPFQQNRIYDVNGKNPALTSQLSCGSNAIEIKHKIRRLTPTECARLQSIPAWYKWNCSDTQAYKMLGNGWNVEVIKHILKHI